MTKMSKSRFLRREGKRLGMDLEADEAEVGQIFELVEKKLVEVGADRKEFMEVEGSYCEVCDSFVSLLFCDKGSFRIGDNGRECCRRVYDGMVEAGGGDMGFSFH